MKILTKYILYFFIVVIFLFFLITYFVFFDFFLYFTCYQEVTSNVATHGVNTNSQSHGTTPTPDDEESKQESNKIDEGVMLELEKERNLRKELESKLERFSTIDGVEDDVVSGLKNEVNTLDTQLQELRTQLGDYEKWFGDSKPSDPTKEIVKTPTKEDETTENETTENKEEKNATTLAEDLIPWVTKVIVGTILQKLKNKNKFVKTLRFCIQFH